MGRPKGSVNVTVRSDKGRHYTHCRRGHEFTTENTKVRSNGSYRCIECESKEKPWSGRKEWLRERDLNRRGWTITLFHKQLEKQNNLCAICNKEMNLDAKFNLSRACADHNHETNKPRGILCANCNVGIGNLQDDPKLLEAAAAYIRWHGGENAGIL